MASRRILHEFKELNTDDSICCVARPVESEINTWNLAMHGPKDTPYETGSFLLQAVFSADHPFSPPVLRFQTKVYHPNIDAHGNICIDILKDKWSPVLSISKIITSIQSLLAEPNPHDPLVQESADLYLDDREQFNAKARLWCNLYASSATRI
jgi:ubiquitin-conjugating enzyme E2 D/E